MKITLTHGLGISIGGAVLTLILYFLGFHDLEKFKTGQTIAMWAGYTIIIIGLILGMKAVREASPDRSLSYGRAVGTGALITVFAGLFSAVFMLLYGLVINPEYHETLHQFQVQQMEEKGMASDQIEAAAPMMRFFTGPIFIALATVIFSPIMGTLFSLVIAIFLKRPPVTTPPPIQA